jgi:muramidase (phage lysozyme)
MSATPNPLHKYRSYSYHFILLAGPSVETTFADIDNTEDKSDLSRYSHPDNAADRYTAKTTSAGNKYSVIYNSMQDADFSIVDLEISHVFQNTPEKSLGFSLEVMTLLNMSILEPFTMDFPAILLIAAQSSAGLSDGADISMAIESLTFGLKIIFVGYLDDYNNNQPHVIDSINVIPFEITTMSMTLSNKGTSYSLKCASLFNDAANSSASMNTGGVSYKSTALLSDALQKLQESVNKRSEENKSASLVQPNQLCEIKLDEAYKSNEYVLEVSDDQRVAPPKTSPKTNNTTPPDKVPNAANSTAKSPSLTDMAGYNIPSNNNIGNIRNTNGKGFQSYATPEEGRKALSRQIGLYSSKHGIHSLRAFTNRYAPKGDGKNNPEAYAQFLSKQTGVSLDDKNVDFTDPKINEAMTNAVARMEQGGGKHSGKVTPANNKNNKTDVANEEVDYIILNTSIGEHILDSIQKIISLCPKIREEYNISGDKVFYKPVIKSYTYFNKDKQARTLIYSIEKTVMETEASIDDKVAAQSKEDPAVSNTQNNNQVSTDDTKLPSVLEYDYIYTGKNLDILQFDMSYNGSWSSGHAFKYYHPQSVITNKQLNDNVKDITDPAETDGDKKQTGAINPTIGTVPSNRLANTPISPPVMDPTRAGSGSMDPQTLFQSRKVISDIIGQTAEKHSLKIIGNPLLLAGYTPPNDTYVNADGTSKSAEESKKVTEDHNNKYGTSESMPTCKVNVRVPKPSYMQGGSDASAENYYSTPGWYQDSYYVYQVDSKFSKGEFTQILTLCPVPASDGMQDSNQPAKKGGAGGGGGGGNGGLGNGSNGDPNSTPESNDNLTAFMKTIGKLETDLAGDDGYNQLVMISGRRTFDDYSHHPFDPSYPLKYQPFVYKDGRKSTASGRYQIVWTTFNDHKQSDFSKASQDKVCKLILKSIGILDLVIAGKINTAVAHKSNALGNQWSSMPSSKISTIIKLYHQYGGTVTDGPNPDVVQPTSGGGNSKLVQIALGEVGFKEGPNNDTKYGAEAGTNHKAWCAAFVMWCAKRAGAAVPMTPLTSAMASQFKSQGKWINNSTQLQPGDIVFYTHNDGNIGHCGIVVKDNGDGTFNSVEGNTTGGGVATRTHSKRDATGFGRP